jgi:hypothetical protein
LQSGEYWVLLTILHCKVASIGFYLSFHFVLYVLLTILHFLLCIASIWWLFVWLYFSTMHILWDRQSQYDVLLIIHATKVLKSLVYDSWLQVTFVAFMMSKTSYWDGLLTGYLHCSNRDSSPRDSYILMILGIIENS